MDQFDGTTCTKLPAPPSGLIITGLADTAAGLWAAGYVEFSCGEGQVCTNSAAALWNGTAWTQVPAGGGTALSGVVAAGSQVLAASGAGVVALSLTGATAQPQHSFVVGVTKITDGSSGCDVAD